MQWNSPKRPSTASAASRSVISSAARAGSLRCDLFRSRGAPSGRAWPGYAPASDVGRGPQTTSSSPSSAPRTRVDKSPEGIPSLAAVLQPQASQAPVRKLPALSAPKLSKDTLKYASASYKRSSPGLLGEARVRPWQESCYFSRTAGLYLTVHKGERGPKRRLGLVVKLVSS